jgi:hypothetical protein
MRRPRAGMRLPAPYNRLALGNRNDLWRESPPKRPTSRDFGFFVEELFW